MSTPSDGLLLILADALDDLERVRIATENRIRSLIALPSVNGDSAKGLGDDEARTAILAALDKATAAKWRQFCTVVLPGLNVPSAVVDLAEMLDGMLQMEHQATLALNRAMRAHPLGAHVKRTVGVGEKQAARLLAAIGDPADRPNVAKLWQYCGHGDPARSRRVKGVQGLPFSPTAKMRTYLIAESCIKQARSPYRPVYDRERAKWEHRTHSAPCDRCSPKGQPPAPVGSPMKDGHRHGHAMRVVGKAMLLDLWVEATSRSTESMAGSPAADLETTTLRQATHGAESKGGPPAADLEATSLRQASRSTESMAGSPAADLEATNLRQANVHPETNGRAPAADLWDAA